MYMYKDGAGFYLTNNYYSKITYVSDDDYTTEDAEYIGFIEDYNDVVNAVVEHGGDDVDILLAMDDLHDEYSFID